MSVITRFAPSPTGYLHIGGARTALFNWLFARHHQGIFRLRIEDTDRARSTQEAINAILEGMSWLGLQWDDEVFYQSHWALRHQEVAHTLLKEGKAYPCYCTPEALQQMREEAQKEGRPPRYDRRCRDLDPNEAPKDIKPAIRLKAPVEGETEVMDLVQGKVTVRHDQLDDLILLRADGTPTYMLSVVVDDHDMKVTHIIRGDDHLTNTFRQIQIYRAMEWELPKFAHIPLIHGADGAKLSKRHGALGVEAYREMGFLPEALCNYLLRLGWSHGDDEIISRAQAIEWFDLEGVGRSAARFDMAKLTNLSGHYLREKDDQGLLHLLEQEQKASWTDLQKSRLLKGMPGLKQRAKTLVELAESTTLYTAARPLVLDEKAQEILAPQEVKTLLKTILAVLNETNEWQEKPLEAYLRQYAEIQGIKFGQIAQPLRAALTGRGVSPGLFEVMEVLGKEESLARLSDVVE